MAHVHDQYLTLLFSDVRQLLALEGFCSWLSRLGLDVLMNFTGIDDRMLSMIRVYAPEI